MSSNKTANQRQNNSRGQANAQKTTSKSRKKKSVNGTVRLSGTVRMRTGLGAVDTSYVTADPYQTETTENVVKKRDTTEFEILRKSVIDNVALTTMGLQTESDAPQRIAWRAPEYTVTTSVTGDTVVVGEMDSRGVLTKMTGARVTFSNVSGDEIIVRGNTPKAVMDQQGDIANRTNPFELTLKEKETRSINVGFGGGKRGYPHLTPIHENDTEHIMYALLDYYVCVNKKSKETGAEIPMDATVVNVKAEVHYEVSEETVPGATITKVQEFAVLALKSFENLFLIDPPIHGLFSDDSRKQLYTDLECWRPVPVATKTATPPTMITLMAGPENFDAAMRTSLGNFMYIPGARQGDMITIPTPISLVSGTSPVIKGPMSNVFKNIGPGDLVLIESTTTQTLSQRWVLVDNSVSQAIWDFSSSGDVKMVAQELAFPPSFTVGYWSGSSPTAMQVLRAQSRKGYRRPNVKIAVLTVIAWLSAAVEILKVVKAAKERAARRN